MLLVIASNEKSFEFIGWAVIQWERNVSTAFLGVFVHPISRRKRIGTALVTSLLELAKALGLRLRVRPPTEAGQLFYENFDLDVVEW